MCYFPYLPRHSPPELKVTQKYESRKEETNVYVKETYFSFPLLYFLLTFKGKKSMILCLHSLPFPFRHISRNVMESSLHTSP